MNKRNGATNGSPKPALAALCILCIFLNLSCRSQYYSFWETLGKEKRELLRDQVEKVGKNQEDASEEFEDVLSQIREIYGFQGGNLEKAYNKLHSEYTDCENRVKEVSERIRKVEQISSDLFREWEKELEQISNPDLRDKSRQKLTETRNRYSILYESMIKSEKSMMPVLKNLNNYVLYLKHNLNAQAVGALKSEMEDIEVDIADVKTEIAKSVQEADEFLKQLN